MRRLWLTVSILVAAFGLVALSASTAEATCGDYLDHQGMADHDQSHMPNDQHRTPCHGPTCQKGPVHPPLPTPVVSVEPQDRWGWTANVVLPTLEQSSSLVHLCEPVVLPMIAFRLDRPPKA